MCQRDLWHLAEEGDLLRCSPLDDEAGVREHLSSLTLVQAEYLRMCYSLTGRAMPADFLCFFLASADYGLRMNALAELCERPRIEEAILERVRRVSDVAETSVEKELAEEALRKATPGEMKD